MMALPKIFVDSETPIVVDGEIIRVIGSPKQCAHWSADGTRCTRPKVAGSLCKVHAKEAADKARCDHRHADLILPERKHWEFEGNESALVEK